jgi:hypothetical protein
MRNPEKKVGVNWEAQVAKWLDMTPESRRSPKALDGWLKNAKPTMKREKRALKPEKPHRDKEREYAIAEQYADVLRKMPGISGRTEKQEEIKMAEWLIENIPGEYHVWTLLDTCIVEYWLPYTVDEYRYAGFDHADRSGWAGRDMVADDPNGVARLKGSKWLNSRNVQDMESRRRLDEDKHKLANMRYVSDDEWRTHGGSIIALECKCSDSDEFTPNEVLNAAKQGGFVLRYQDGWIGTNTAKNMGIESVYQGGQYIGIIK